MVLNRQTQDPQGTKPHTSLLTGWGSLDWLGLGQDPGG